MSQLSIFDEMEKAEADRLAALQEERSKPVTCSHCGEESPNAALDQINHGIIFNGWCGKRLWFNGWASEYWADKSEQCVNRMFKCREWLSVRGWVACDEHDRANWPEGHIPYWEVQK